MNISLKTEFKLQNLDFLVSQHLAFSALILIKIDNVKIKPDINKIIFSYASYPSIKLLPKNEFDATPKDAESPINDINRGIPQHIICIKEQPITNE